LKRIGIVGAGGFFGNALCKVSDDFNFQIIPITRENFENYKKDKFEVLINTAMPSKKYWASINPYSDFQKSVCLTTDLVYNWNYDKFIQISTISINEIEKKHPYAVNKKAAEIIASFAKSLIVRLGAIYGAGLSKGSLFDLLNSNKLYADIKSEYNYINTEFVARWIFTNIDRLGVVELGAKDTISLLEIAKTLKLKVEGGERFERVFSPNVEAGMPSAKEVLEFAKSYKKNS